MDYSEIHNDKKTKFDVQLVTLLHIRELLNQNNSNSIASAQLPLDPDLLRQWKYTTLSVYREIHAIIKKEDRTEIEDQLKNIKKIPAAITKTRNEQGEIQSKINTINYYKHWEALDKLDKKVRQKAQKHNMLVSFKETIWD